MLHAVKMATAGAAVARADRSSLFRTTLLLG
jgi:hypothetical protein